jgi:hypothetical protein
MNEILVRVEQIEIRTASRGGYNYKVVFFKEVESDGKKDTPTGKRGNRCLWPRRVNVKTRYSDTGEIKFETWPGDAEFDSVSVGQLFDGRILEYNTTELQIDGKPITKFSCVIFESDRDKMKAAAKQIDFYGGSIFNSNGDLYQYRPEKIEVFE